MDYHARLRLTGHSRRPVTFDGNLALGVLLHRGHFLFGPKEVAVGGVPKPPHDLVVKRKPPVGAL